MPKKISAQTHYVQGRFEQKLLMKFLNTKEKNKEGLFMCLCADSDESSYVTDTEFVVDSGITAVYATSK